MYEPKFIDRFTTMKSLALLLAALFMPATAAGSITVFDVNLSGTAISGHTLAVTGTITLDPDTDVISGSSLFFQHENDAPITFPSIPSASGTPGNLDWVVSGTSLYINRLSNTEQSLFWQNNSGATGSLRFGSGPRAHFLEFSIFPDFDVFILKGESGPDGPNGFLVGSRAAIPEPTSAVVWAAVFSIGIACTRRRRNRLPAEV